MRIGAHAARALRSKFAQFSNQAPVGFKELLRPVAAQPGLQDSQTLRVVADVREWNLMRTPGTFCLVSLYGFWTGPALRRPQHDHRPARALRLARGTRFALDRTNAPDSLIQCGSHLLVHFGRIGTFDEDRCIAVADEQGFQLLVADPRKDGRVRDLVAIQVEDGQHRAVAHRVQELVRVPGRCERTGLGLAVTYDTCDDELRVVEHRAIGMRHAVTEFAALVDRAGCLWRDVGADVARKGELLEELLHPLCVFALVGVDLGVGSLQIAGPEYTGRSVSRPCHEDHIEVVTPDQPVQMGPHERERRARTPVPEQALLDVINAQWLTQQRVVLQVDHAYCKVIAGTPPGVHASKLLAVERGGCGWTPGCHAEISPDGAESMDS